MRKAFTLVMIQNQTRGSSHKVERYLALDWYREVTFPFIHTLRLALSWRKLDAKLNKLVISDRFLSKYAKICNIGSFTQFLPGGTFIII